MRPIERRLEGWDEGPWRASTGVRMGGTEPAGGSTRAGRRRPVSRKGDAERFLDGVRGDLARGQYVDPAGGRVLFQEYAEQWRATQMHRPSTAAQAETNLRVHAYPRLGKRPLGAIRRSAIQAWVNDRAEVLSPGTVEVVYPWVASVFKAAVGDRLIAASPCDRIALPKRKRREIVPLEVEAVERLVAALPPATGP
jgi:hypothetical protein